MRKIIVFYHGLLFLGDPPEPLPNALEIVCEQMDALKQSGLEEAAQAIYVGVNGGEESVFMSESVFPKKANITFHGLKCRNELRTIQMIEELAPYHHGWNVLYFHSKAASRKEKDPHIINWRKCLMDHLVWDWRTCSGLLDQGFDSVGCHWLTGQVDGTQNLWAGNFWWARSEFLLTLPMLDKNPRIPLMGGIDSEQSRWEAEIWLGGGHRLPKVKDFHPGWPFKHA